MRTFPTFLSALTASLCLAAAQQQPALLADPPDGSEVPAAEVHAVFKPAEVLESTVTRQGGREIIVHHLALDPNNPVKPVVPARPAPALPIANCEPQDAPAPSYLSLLSATVYPGPRTRFSWVYHCKDGSTIECAGWSNIDFNHFSGISTFLGTDGEAYSLIMGIGNEELPSEEAPVFRTTDPTFIPDQKDLPAEALVLIDSLHKIYAMDGAKLAAAHAGRERATKAKEAELLANPPQPKDLIIRYRIAETPLPTSTVEGAQ